MGKKFIFYLKGVGRGIVITDPEDVTTLDEVSNKIDSVLSGKVVAKFSSGDDALIVRSNEIIGVHVIDDEDKFKRVAYEDDNDSMNVVPEIDLDGISESIDGKEEVLEEVEDVIPEELLEEEETIQKNEDESTSPSKSTVDFVEEELPQEPDIPDDVLQQADKINEEE